MYEPTHKHNKQGKENWKYFFIFLGPSTTSVEYTFHAKQEKGYFKPLSSEKYITLKWSWLTKEQEGPCNTPQRLRYITRRKHSLYQVLVILSKLYQNSLWSLRLSLDFQSPWHSAGDYRCQVQFLADLSVFSGWFCIKILQIQLHYR